LIVATLTPYGTAASGASGSAAAETGADASALAAAAPPASDLEVTAASGCLWLAGEPGRPPLRTSLPQTPAWTGLYAAAGVLTALLARDLTGRGQHVDVSAQASMLTATSQAPIFWDLLRQEQARQGAFLVGRSVTGARFRNIWPCRDGFVTFALYGGQAGRTTARKLAAWMDEAGGAASPGVLHSVDWDTFDVATASPELVERIEAAVAPFFARLTKAEFFHEVSARGMLGYPVSTVEDVAADEQLAARDFWQTIPTPWGEPLRAPGSFGLFDGQRPRLRRAAPGLGEHNVEVYCGELGLQADELAALRAAGVV
jgi:crotonobetainyl-CoA:carnitine CoA-transferase CaiB-like acyl-CoA transferase